MLYLFKGGVIGYDLCLRAAIRHEYKKKIERSFYCEKLH